MNEIALVVREKIAEVLKVPAESLTNELSVGDIPQWSSMAQMSIITALQEEFNVEIPMEDLFDLTSVQSLVDEIVRLKD